MKTRLLMIVCFAAIHIVWGTTYLAIHYAVQTIPPLLTAGLRHLFGGGALFAFCWWRGLRPTAAQWRASLAVGALFFLIGHGSLHWAEQYVASGAAALFVTTEPVWVAALTARQERLSPAALAGLVVGIAGVAILVGVPGGGAPQLIGSLAIVLGAISWSIGIVVSRAVPLHPSTIMSAAMSLLAGGAQLVVAALLTGSLASFNIADVSAASAAGLAYLVVFGSLTFAAYTWLLTRCSPVLVATHTYTNPLIAVLLGAAIAGEPLTMRMAVAAAAILGAIALVRHKPKSLAAAACCFAAVAARAQLTQPLATGVRLDPAGAAVDLGSMPINMALAPDGRHLAVVLSGWREQGLQIVDLQSRTVTQTLTQPAAFYGAAFAPDGAHLYVSGGNDDSIFVYGWANGAATLERKIALGKGRYPAGIAVSKNGRYLYVAENVGDALAVVDVATGDAQRLPTDHYPYAVELAGGDVYVSAWGADTVSIFSARADGLLVPRARLRVGRHPSALVSGKGRLFVALAGSDRIAVIDSRTRKVVNTLTDSAPGAPSEGSTPNAMALSADGATLYAAEADNNAVAVFDVAGRKLKGRIPTDWYPTAIIRTGNELLVLNGKGHGSHANPDGPTPGQGITRPFGYALGQLSGTLRIIGNPSSLADASRRVAAANNWSAPRPPRHYPPFKHVVYIIKENRTYDQVFGDLKEGDGDPSLVFFDRTSTPNHRALALRFGLFDRFFTNAEVSSQGHIWSTAAYVTDFGEKLVPSGYSDRRDGIDGEDIDEPEGGFLWTLAKKAGVSFRDYGEMVKPGWPRTQPGLGSDISPSYPPYDPEIRDQKRADAWIDELRGFVAGGNMPALEVLHLPMDHTAGGSPKYRTPRAYMADNDLALGRIVDALSHSPYWPDTVIFVLEDDSQAGPDHVDSHRGPLLVISAYSRGGTIHRFANTTDVVAAIEDILGLGRLSKYDYFSRSLADVFTAKPDLTPYSAITPEANMEEMNPPKTAAAAMSEGLDFSGPDRIDDARFNAILWTMLKGGRPMPATQTKASLHLLQISK